MIAHATYGTAVGALYGLIFGKREHPPKNENPQATGIAYGIAVWSVSYLAMLPALGLLKPATKHPARRNTLMILAHLVWGSLTGVVFNHLQQKLNSFSSRCARRCANGTQRLRFRCVVLKMACQFFVAFLTVLAILTRG